MSRIRSVSKLETDARREVTRRAGVRLRHQPKGLVGRPDYANKARLVAVFVHGCWWHMCPRCFKPPKVNVEFWMRKFRMNVERHGKVETELRAAGWTVIVVWEHELRKKTKA